ncbi:HEPN domain-containing protein [Caldimicrobium thiodismutans]|nr:HEPN domain-containing protein [Caldimicrobium thiodismutans]
MKRRNEFMFFTMPERSKDWLNQALKDLEHAKLSLEHKNYEWACFASHQEVIAKETLWVI